MLLDGNKNYGAGKGGERSNSKPSSGFGSALIDEIIGKQPVISVAGMDVQPSVSKSSNQKSNDSSRKGQKKNKKNAKADAPVFQSELPPLPSQVRDTMSSTNGGSQVESIFSLLHPMRESSHANAKNGASASPSATHLLDFDALEKKSGCGRVIIEYNGMWLIQELYDALPDNWLVYQSLATADGTTIKTYAGDSAMRSLLLDKLRGSELLVVNRAEAVNDDESRQLIHKLVRQASRRCDIAYEFKDGSVAYDDIPDPLPFDVDAPVIEIPEEFFGIWYMDCMDDPKKYDGKTVKYLAQVCQTPQAGKGAFVPGRFAMTCCVQDIQFVGMPCKYDDYKSLEQRSWINITAKVNVKYHPIYKGQTPDSTGPVLTALSVEPAEKPAQDVVMFS